MADVEALLRRRARTTSWSRRSCRRRARAARRRPRAAGRGSLQPARRRGARGGGRRGRRARSGGSRAVSRARWRMCAAADLVLCANERQRDLWIGGMALHGLIDPETYARDPTLRSLVAVVRFGLPTEPPPAPTRRAARGVPRDRRRRPRARCGAAASGIGSTRRRRCARWTGSIRASTSSCSVSAVPGLEASGQQAAGERRSRRAPRGARDARPRQFRLGPVRGARAVARRGRSRGLRAPRSSRGALRAPHAPARRPVGGVAGRHHARRRAGRADRARAARRDDRAGRRRRLRRGVRAPARAGRRRRPGAGGGGGAGAALERAGGAARRVVHERAAAAARRRDVVRRAALTQYRWALAETLARAGPRRGGAARRAPAAAGGAPAMRVRQGIPQSGSRDEAPRPRRTRACWPR